MGWLRLRKSPERALTASTKSYAVLVVVIACIVVGLFLLKKLNTIRTTAARAAEDGRALDMKALRAGITVDVPVSGESRDIREALAASLATLDLSDGAKRYQSAEELFEALQPLLVTTARYPDAQQLVEVARRELAEPEHELSALKDEKATERVQRLMRARGFALDRLRLALIALPERQRTFLIECRSTLGAVASSVPRSAAGPPGRSALESFMATAARRDEPVHLVYQFAFYVILIAVVLALSYCAGIFLKLLPFPGTTDRWDTRVDQMLSFGDAPPAPRPAGKTGVASLLLSLVLLGMGTIAASDAIRSLPSSPVYDAGTFSLLSAGGEAGGSAEGTAASASLSAAGANAVSDSLSIANVSIANEAVASSALFATLVPPTPIDVPPATHSVTVHAELDGLGLINGALRTLSSNVSENRTQLGTLTAAATRIADEQPKLTQAVEVAGNEIRTALASVDENAGSRHITHLNQEAVWGTRQWWKRATALQQYRVTPLTSSSIGEPSGCDSFWHARLKGAIEEMGDLAYTPQYKAPFEETIIWRMCGKGGEDPRPPTEEYNAARKEVRRHLALILQFSQIAE